MYEIHILYAGNRHSFSVVWISETACRARAVIIICRKKHPPPVGTRRSRSCPYVRAPARPSDMAAACCPASHPPLAREGLATPCALSGIAPGVFGRLWASLGVARLSGLPPVLAQTAKLRDASVYSITHPPPHCKSFCAHARDTILIWRSNRYSLFFRLTIFLARQQECPLLFIEKRAARRWLFFMRNDFRTGRQRRLRSFRPRNES